MDTIERVRALAEPLLLAEETELIDVELHAGAVRLTVDRPDGVDLALITRAARHVAEALDHDEAFTVDYTLEVSSPGLERPLRGAAQFARAVGSEVAVKTVAGTEGERRIHGRLASADDSEISVVDAAGDEHRVAYVQIERARTVFEWGPGPKPGHKPKPGQKPGTAQKARSAQKPKPGRKSRSAQQGSAAEPRTVASAASPAEATVVEEEAGDR